MTNPDIARALDETADLLELQGANAFRVRAYRNAARAVEDHPQAISLFLTNAQNRLTDLPGVGKDLAEKIHSLVDTGSFPLLDELRSEFPRSMLEVLRLPGLGPKKAASLFRELQVRSLDDLRAAAQQDRIAGLKGFGKKTQQSLLENLDRVAKLGQRALLIDARIAAETILADLLHCPGAQQGSVAGSCRRRKETCGDLDLLVTAASREEVMDRLAAHPLVEQVLARGETKQRVRLRDGLELDLRVVPAESFGAALQYFTGSKEHNIVIRRRAQERSLKLNEYGLFRGEEQVAGSTEEEIYAAVDLPWIPPELRENRGEIERAERGELPELVTLADIQGDLHMHTTASDGGATLRAMIEAARDRGRKYIAITDHSPRVSMANGLNPDRLRAQWREIRALRDEYDDIEILCGVECDILENAELDLPDDVLREADWVLAVLHYGLRQPREQIMRRLLNAVQNPYVTAIGHPSGRMIGRRPGADIDFPTFLKAASDHGVLLEINANPNRLDLDDVQAAAARERGIPIVINTDAHSVNGLDLMEYGVFQARRAGLARADVANTLPWNELRARLRTAR